MKKVIKFICFVLSLVIINTAYAEEVFVPAIKVDDSISGKIIVTVPDEADNAAIFADKKPSFSIPCSFEKAHVEYDGKEVLSKLQDGEIIFIIDKCGVYTVIEDKVTSTSSSSSGGGGSSNKNTINVISGSTTAKAIISGTTATISKITTSSTDKEISIDLSDTGKNVDTAKISASIVKDVAKNGNVEIKLSEATISFDGVALDTITKELGNNQLSLKVNKVSEESINSSQKDAVKKLNNVKLYDFSLKAGSKTISDFKGGKVEIEIDVGKNIEGIIKVNHIDDEGKITELNATYDKVTGIAKITLTHFSLYAVTFEEEIETTEIVEVPKFTDVKEGAWYEHAIKFAVEKGIMKGTGYNSFEPSGKTTRAMLVQILYNLEGTPTIDGNSSFTDVKTDAWYEEAIVWATNNKIVNGMGDNNFAPNLEITREQMVTILHNYAKFKEMDVSVGENTNILSYEDAFEILEWAIPAFQWATGSGIISGRTESTLGPKGTATRAEIATVMMNFLK